MRPVTWIAATSLLWLSAIAQNSKPWAGWPQCVVHCAAGSNCESPEKPCFCTPHLFDCTEKVCIGDDHNIRDRMKNLCTPTASSSSSSRPSSSSSSTSQALTSSASVSTTTSVSASTTSTTTLKSLTPILSTSMTALSSTVLLNSVKTGSGSPNRAGSTITISASGKSATGTTISLTLIDPPVPSSSPNDLSTTDKEKGNKSNAGTIAGGIIGGLAALAILMALVRWSRRSDTPEFEGDLEEKAEPPLVQQTESPPAERRSESSDISYVTDRR